MGELEIRLDRPHLGADLALGVVARVRQIKDSDGNFPAAPEEHDVVIPAGSHEIRRIENLPAGTYRIEARLPSGEVLRATRTINDAQPSAPVVFETGYSPHEWLSFQRLAGNVPSQGEYEKWINQIADQINAFAKAKLDAAKPIEITPETISKWSGWLHGAHVKIQPVLQSLGELLDKAMARVDTGGAGGDRTAPMPPEGAPQTTAAVASAEFELLQTTPEHAALLWDAVGSLPAWNAWRNAAEPDAALSASRHDDREITLWRIDQRNRGRRAPGPSGRPAPWRSFAVTRRGGGLDVIPLPVPWPFSEGLPPASIEILREAGTSESGRTTLTVRDDSVGSLIMYLGSGRISDAATVLAEAQRAGVIEELINEKSANPFAACAAGYVGIATLAVATDLPRWTGWLRNLMDWFEWLPDGAVIRGALLLKTAKQRADLEASLAAFKTAYRCGIPFYSAGLQHLMNGLYTFSESDAEAKAMHQKVAAVASRVDPNPAFTQITILST